MQLKVLTLNITRFSFTYIYVSALREAYDILKSDETFDGLYELLLDYKKNIEILRDKFDQEKNLTILVRIKKNKEAVKQENL